MCLFNIFKNQNVKKNHISGYFEKSLYVALKNCNYNYFTKCVSYNYKIKQKLISTLQARAHNFFYTL